ncbi:MAG: hypothetical protein H7Y09_07930 [Chitinophagaceae bacterium]|nr:hypothetical protein [Anaerolineae bacterium]
MKFRLILIAAFPMILAACGPTPELRNENFLRDTSFLTDEPCGAPCWRGITPGETAWNDALTIIEDDATLDELKTEASDNSPIIGAVWSQKDGDGCCQMYTEDGENVDIIILQTAPDATLGQVIEKWGEPLYAAGEPFSDDQAVFSLFYPDVPMLVYAFVAGEAGELSDASEIIGFGYFAPDRMDLLLQASNLHTWDGYQSFADYMNSEYEVTPSITLTPIPEN